MSYLLCDSGYPKNDLIFTKISSASYDDHSAIFPCDVVQFLIMRILFADANSWYQGDLGVT